MTLSKLPSFSQSLSEKNNVTFRITKLGDNYSQETVIKAFEGANMSFHHFSVAPNLLTLDDGTQVELYPAVKLTEHGLVQDPQKYKSTYPSNYILSVFSIKNNILVEQRPIGKPEKNKP